MTALFASYSEGVFVDVHSHGGTWDGHGALQIRAPPTTPVWARSGRNLCRSAGTVSGCQRCPINYVSPNTCFVIGHTAYIGMTNVSFACLAFR
jgi:hypothetical protein